MQPSLQEVCAAPCQKPTWSWQILNGPIPSSSCRLTNCLTIWTSNGRLSRLRNHAAEVVFCLPKLREGVLKSQVRSIWSDDIACSTSIWIIRTFLALVPERRTYISFQSSTLCQAHWSETRMILPSPLILYCKALQFWSGCWYISPHLLLYAPCAMPYKVSWSPMTSRDSHVSARTVIYSSKWKHTFLISCSLPHSLLTLFCRDFMFCPTTWCSSMIASFFWFLSRLLFKVNCPVLWRLASSDVYLCRASY